MTYTDGFGPGFRPIEDRPADRPAPGSQEATDYEAGLHADSPKVIDTASPRNGIVELTLDEDRHGYRLRGPDDEDVFAISPSTSRNSQHIVIRFILAEHTTQVDCPEGVSKYSREAAELALPQCTEALREFLAKRFGLDVDVRARPAS